MSKRSRECTDDNIDKVNKTSVKMIKTDGLINNIKSTNGNNDNESKKNGKKSSRVEETDENYDELFSQNDNELANEFFTDFFDNDVTELKSNNCNSISSSCVSLPSKIDKTNDSGLNTLDCQIESDIDGFSDEWDEDELFNINFKTYKRCQIIEIEKKHTFKRLTVKDIETMQVDKVSISGSWLTMTINVNEFIIIKAERQNCEWVVNNDFGLCVTKPDVLIPGSTVVTGLFCQRKGILMHKFSNIDCIPTSEKFNVAMSCGSLVHILIQTALKENLHEIEDIKKALDEILQSIDTILLLYSTNLTTKEVKKLLDEYVDRIHEFMKRYVLGDKPNIWDEQMFNGKIEKVRDIEESVWIPSLGLKGKIDVTTEVSIQNKRKIMPLEIKTGKASFSSEHKGQLFMYCMMLEASGYEVDSGLLLYIKDNLMKEVRSSRHDTRDLILFRNSMAHYYNLAPKLVEEGKEGEKINNPDGKSFKWIYPELPDPINHPLACKRCEYNIPCCIYAKEDKELDLPQNHSFSKVSESLLKDIPENYINYVLNWSSMLQLEEEYNSDLNDTKKIWMQKPSARESLRTCLSYLKIDGPIIKQEDKYLHTFIRDNSFNVSDHKKTVENFEEVYQIGDYVMVNTDTRFNIKCGHVAELNHNSITIMLDKDMTQLFKTDELIYHLDMYAFEAMFSRLISSSVMTLLYDYDITRKLRKIIIDKEPATFTRPLSEKLTSDYCKGILYSLNFYQREAVKMILRADDYILIKGMPGTGKTQTLVALIQILSYLGHSILITAHTHIAIDNILLKLKKKKIDFLRLGSRSRVHADLSDSTEHVMYKDCDSPEKLDHLFMKKNIVAVTCLGSAGHALLSKRTFDYCLIDECSQALQPILLRPLYLSTRYVFFGDPEQLPAVVKCPQAKKLGMAEDIFTRLDSTNNTRVLKQQYRMNQTIMDLSNKLTYDDSLLAGNSDIANATLKLENYDIVESSKETWVRKTLSCDLKDAVVMLNVSNKYKLSLDVDIPFRNDTEAMYCSSFIEAAVVLKLVNVLVASGVATNNIGIISPYRIQVNLLRFVVPHKIEINTVDQYQGRDKNIILFSCGKSITNSSNNNFDNEYEILNDHKRLNVAVSRAKHKLIIVGDKNSLSKFTPFKKLFEILRDKTLTLKPGVDDFTWESLKDVLEQSIHKSPS